MKITRLTTYAVPPRWLFRTHNAFIQEQSLGIHYNIGNHLLDYRLIGRYSTMPPGLSLSPADRASASTSTRTTSKNAAAGPSVAQPDVAT